MTFGGSQILDLGRPKITWGKILLPLSSGVFAATVPLHPPRVHLLFGYFGRFEKMSTSTVNRTILKVKIFPHPRPAIARSLRFRDSTCCPARRAVSRLGRRLQHSCAGLELVGPTTLKSPDKPDDNYSDNLKISLKLPDSYLIARMITLK